VSLGQSTQHQGVIPDISYPADMDINEIGESALPEAMPWDSIKPAYTPSKDPFKPFIAELKARPWMRAPITTLTLSLVVSASR